MRVNDEAALAIATALDEKQDAWVPMDGTADLLLVPADSVSDIPPALVSVAVIAINTIRKLGWRSAYEK